MEQYGKIIASLRKQHNMTQAELGDKLNVTYQAISKWENDQSQPDFATMAKIAELFNVPLTIFLNENSSETATTTAQTASQPQTNTIGFCKNCGIIVNADNIGQQQPYILCDNCKTAQENALKLKKEQAEKASQQAKEDEVRQAEAEKATRRKMRNRGLIWGAVIAIIFLITGLVIAFTSKKIASGILEAGLVTLFMFTFVSQLFWKGFIVDTVLFGGKIVGMPGVIFTFDMDGFIFLIAMKFLFALLKMLIFIITFLLAAVFAYVISPFTFFFALHRVNTKGEA